MRIVTNVAATDKYKMGRWNLLILRNSVLFISSIMQCPLSSLVLVYHIKPIRFRYYLLSFSYPTLKLSSASILVTRVLEFCLLGGNSISCYPKRIWNITLPNIDLYKKYGNRGSQYLAVCFSQNNPIHCTDVNNKRYPDKFCSDGIDNGYAPPTGTAKGQQSLSQGNRAR